MSRSLDDLQKPVADKARAFFAACDAAKLRVICTCTLRTNAQQAALWAQGRTAPGAIVTWARPGTSLHEMGRAFDVVPMRGGVCVWGTTGADGVLWRQLGAIGEGLGLTWGGRWANPDFPHFQYDLTKG